MDDEEKDPTFAPGLSCAEHRLSALKPYAHLAWEECKAPAEDGSGSAQLRWEIFSTWMLLLCLHHTEAERERCERWQCQAWTTEEKAMRHLFMRNYHLRALQAILRWLRWAHRWAPQADRKEEFPAYTASYERTRRAQQLRRLPSPVQACSVLHPDGPLQHSQMFEPADLEDERQLVADLWICLRRGELSKGLKLCAESGQAWRTALLQGMLPFAEADGQDLETVGPDEETEEMLALMKEEHTDWTEFGQPKHYSHGNPWRRLWKEQCFDAAARNLQCGAMDLCELSIYGFCSGNYDALMPYCGTSWADRCWGELHCLKEWLVERLLDDGRVWCNEESLCTSEDEDRHPSKLCGRLASGLSPELGRAVSEEVQQILLRVLPRSPGDARWEVPESVSEQFAFLQALLIESAWIPERGQAALDLLRGWLGEGAPFLVKQFASYFALWQREMLQVSKGTEAMPEVDDIILEHVQELIVAASGSHWPEQCLHGKAVEIILEHCVVLQPQLRREAFAELLLRLGSAGPKATIACAVALARGEFTAQAQVMKRCFSTFWSRFPDEVFAMMAGLVHRVLKLDEPQEARLEEVPAGAREQAHAEDMVHLVLCLLIFWTIARDKAAEGDTVEQAQEGLRSLLGEEVQAPGLLEILAGDPRQAFLRSALSSAIVPLLTDTLLCLCVKDPGLALPMLPPLQASVLWTDAFNSASATANLSDLEWFLLLYVKHSTWRDAFQEASAQHALALKPTLMRYGAAVQPGPGSGHTAEAEKAAEENKVAREALLDWAQDRLARPRALLEPQPRSQTALPEEHVQNLRKALAWRTLQFQILKVLAFFPASPMSHLCQFPNELNKMTGERTPTPVHALLPLIECFEAELDLQGAMQDLFVAIDESPWMLKMLDQRHARSLLLRVARIPMSFEWPP
ncbi:Nuclear pore complex protein Nup107 (107 kDa nucleoporin) (Nucleoporin Nup107) [Durusdinium trenchii]|uniref:Nuclear pore complex protein n=1 Tax=Durusdinium trenchii TaxID=1381693 RepID=A0ABP0KSZ1_9DINO